jgi:nucleoporin POM152
MIESVHDSSRCEQAEPDPLRRSIWIDVAKTATVIPLDKKKDFCVGDVTQFQLLDNWVGWHVCDAPQRCS